MAEDTGDKTEAPTPRRRMESRNKGQIARSQDLNAAVMLLASFMGLALFGPRIWVDLIAIMHESLDARVYPAPDQPIVIGIANLRRIGMALAPFFGTVFIVGLTVLYAQVGWLITFDPLTPNLGKLNPVNGFKRLFSPHSLVQLAQNMLKLFLIVGVAWLTIRSMTSRITHAYGLDFIAVLPFASGLVFNLGVRLLIILLLLAFIDYIYQRYRHEKQLKMTKEEVKEEMKRMEGDPVVKRRRREVQMKLATQRARTVVPQADVIVANPTHFAVALKYDAETMIAPKVIAKGVDFLALKIREIAAEAGVPVVEKPLLARSLYAEVDVGQEVPEKFYRLVAEVLAYVFEMANANLKPRPVPVA